MAEQKAYSTDEPGTIAAYLAAYNTAVAYRERMLRDLKALGVSMEVRIIGGMFGAGEKLVALMPDGDTIPEGWRSVRGRLEPRRGRPGEAARQWLADHQPVDVRQVLTKHGLPRAVPIPGGHGYRLMEPEVFFHDNMLWALYEDEPGASDLRLHDGVCSWTPRKLSEFHAAKEAFEEARKAAA